MLRTSRALLLLLVMAWQTLGWLSPGAVAAQANALMHATVHAQSDAHHHHDNDLSLHVDESNSDTPHWHPDSALQPPCLPPGAAPAIAAKRPDLPAPRHERATLAPLPDGPFRPPRAAA